MIGLFTIYFFNKMITHLIRQPVPEGLKEPNLTRIRRQFSALTFALTAALDRADRRVRSQINEDFKPQNEFKLDPWVEIHILGIDMSINKAVFMVWLACGAHALHRLVRLAQDV